MTKEEKHLWYDFLKKIPLTVHRQQTIGDYIVDFYIPAASLIIELDGSQHYSEKGLEKDAVRDAYLGKTGNTVVRFSNFELNDNFEGVCSEIVKAIRFCLHDYNWSPYTEEN